MITQEVKPKKLSALEGVLLIVGMVAILVAASLLAGIVKNVNPVWGQLAVFLLAGVCVFFLLRSVVVRYQYTVAQSSFYIERVYGRRSSVMLNVPLTDVLFIGTEAQAAQQFEGARIMVNATIAGYDAPMVFLAYRAGNKTHLAKLQLNEEMQVAMRASE